MAMLTWRSLAVSPTELCLAHTLPSGQTFGWHRAEVENETHWVGVVEDKAVRLKQTDSGVDFACIGSSKCASLDQLEQRLFSLFQLSTPLKPMYQRWGQADEKLKVIATHVPGIRILQQDPVECLFSFICSSNNNIKRISQMLTKLREAYGQFICTDTDRKLFQFPTVTTLANVEEQALRDLGFGYRAKFVVKTAKQLEDLGGREWLLKLRQQSYDDVVQSLLQFHGVGHKVADCVALFSLDQTEVIPVDTHVWQIACRDFDPSLEECKSLTPTVYTRVGDLFRKRYGSHAGWAHTIRFVGDLPDFAKLIPEDLRPSPTKVSPKKRSRKKEKTTESSPAAKPTKSGNKKPRNKASKHAVNAVNV